MVKKSLAIAVFLLILALVLSAVLVVIAEDEDESGANAVNSATPVLIDQEAEGGAARIAHALDDLHGRS